MIEITADITNTPPTVLLSGASANSIVEIRSTNLMNGAQSVEVVECDSEGRASLTSFADLSMAFNIYAHELNASNTEELTHLVYSRACDDASLHLISETAYAAMMTEQTAPPLPTPEPIPVTATPPTSNSGA